jgi:hypothetical protein
LKAAHVAAFVFSTAAFIAAVAFLATAHGDFTARI